MLMPESTTPVGGFDSGLLPPPNEAPQVVEVRGDSEEGDRQCKHLSTCEVLGYATGGLHDYGGDANGNQKSEIRENALTNTALVGEPSQIAPTLGPMPNEAIALGENINRHHERGKQRPEKGEQIYHNLRFPTKDQGDYH